ncbi:MAG: hypothetical protein DMG49_09360 [Acidobacteria bacterium]|nr:MAG: hypothetical protein DMG49_09360 [Acidobacteriota bacterium]
MLAEIGDRQFRLARMVLQEIFQFGGVMRTWDLRQRNLWLILGALPPWPTRERVTPRYKRK